VAELRDLHGALQRDRRRRAACSALRPRLLRGVPRPDAAVRQRQPREPASGPVRLSPQSTVAQRLCTSLGRAGGQGAAGEWGGEAAGVPHVPEGVRGQGRTGGGAAGRVRHARAVENNINNGSFSFHFFFERGGPCRQGAS
jgi:hypothetical protein